ncbi:hypothetical protein B0H19DRAFT_1064291 [Mycena capillaripes]|nr:hypothetical protein B0H19DRAFT_1064291 [Mycena capillaripes]
MNVDDEEGDVKYVPERLDTNGSVLEAFSDMFAGFQLSPEESSSKENVLGKGEVIYSDGDMASEADSEDERVTRTSQQSACCLRRVALSTSTSTGCSLLIMLLLDFAPFVNEAYAMPLDSGKPISLCYQRAAHRSGLYVHPHYTGGNGRRMWKPSASNACGRHLGVTVDKGHFTRGTIMISRLNKGSVCVIRHSVMNAVMAAGTDGKMRLLPKSTACDPAARMGYGYGQARFADRQTTPPLSWYYGRENQVTAFRPPVGTVLPDPSRQMRRQTSVPTLAHPSAYLCRGRPGSAMIGTPPSAKIDQGGQAVPR